MGIDESIEQMLWDTWHYHAADWLALFPRHKCKGAEVQECVADADRYADHKNKAAVKAFREMPREQQDAVLNKIFPPTKFFTL